jgi:hypothetical protein
MWELGECAAEFGGEAVAQGAGVEYQLQLYCNGAKRAAQVGSNVTTDSSGSSVQCHLVCRFRLSPHVHSLPAPSVNTGRMRSAIFRSLPRRLTSTERTTRGCAFSTGTPAGRSRPDGRVCETQPSLASAILISARIGTGLSPRGQTRGLGWRCVHRLLLRPNSGCRAQRPAQTLTRSSSNPATGPSPAILTMPVRVSAAL